MAIKRSDIITDEPLESRKGCIDRLEKEIDEQIKKTNFKKQRLFFQFTKKNVPSHLKIEDVANAITKRYRRAGWKNARLLNYAYRLSLELS